MDRCPIFVQKVDFLRTSAKLLLGKMRSGKKLRSAPKKIPKETKDHMARGDYETAGEANSRLKEISYS